MNTISTILIILGCVIAYFAICALISVFIEKHAFPAIDENGRAIISVFWPLSCTVLIPFLVVDAIREMFGLSTEVFKLKKNKD